jgi:hypothetical protein
MALESFSKTTDFSWPSVFAGTFVFLAIEVTFGLLAAAIFGPARASTSLSAGAGIWMIVLSIIALYFGARAAAHFSGAVRRLNGMYYGLVTFGLSIFSRILIATMIMESTAVSARTLLDGVSANSGWLFVTLLLSGLAAAIGGSSSIFRVAIVPVTAERADLRPAA